MKKTLLLPATMIAILMICGVKPDCLEDMESILKENTLTIIVYSQEIENPDIDRFSCTLHGTVVNTCPFEEADYVIQGLEDGRMGYKIVLRDSVIGTSGWYIYIYWSRGICLGINMNVFVSITPTPTSTNVPMVTNILTSASRNLTSTTIVPVAAVVAIVAIVVIVVTTFIGLCCCRSKKNTPEGEPVTRETDGVIVILPEQVTTGKKRNRSSSLPLPKSSVTREAEVVQDKAPYTPEPIRSFLNAGHHLVDDIHNGDHHEDQTIVEGSYSRQCSDKSPISCCTIDNAGKITVA